MKILSWNILSGGFKDYGSPELRPARIDGFVNAIKSINPDFVSLVDTYRWTEVFTPKDLQELFGYLNTLSVNLEDERLLTKGHDNGVTVLTRLSNPKMEVFKMATRNSIRTEMGEVDIFSVYLDDLSEEVRIKQISEVIKLVNHNKPTIIIGDLNTIDKDDLIEANKITVKLASKYPGPMKAMESSLNEMKRGEVTRILCKNGFRDLGKGRGNTVPAKLFPLPITEPAIRLDYAFGNNLVELEEFKVLMEDKFAVLSDHYPIWMNIETK